MRGFLTQLPENQRNVLRLKFQSGLRYNEIADALGLDATQIGARAYSPMVVTHGLSYLVIPVDSLKTARDAVFNHKTWSYSNASDMMISEVLLFTTDTEEPPPTDPPVTP